MVKLKRIILGIIVVIFLLIFIFAFYSNSLLGVNPVTVEYYYKLKKELEEQGYSANTLVISGRRFGFQNSLLMKYGNVVKNSLHLKGQAIDILVFDVNNDGENNGKDVDIVYKLLDKQVIKNKGGIGTYKKQKGFYVHHMVHFDCRGYRARWNR